ncbi:MAG: hypothetical protein OEV78_07575 [Spirochaetia bacterium]|nr:hypothetical protein [Spirochaetia bacterium]
MEADVYRTLMRFFFQYQTDILLCVQDKIIVGTINKRIIEELMSDLSHAKTSQEIPIHNISSQDETLEALFHHGVMVNNQKVLPVVDKTGNFIALWSKSEILGSSLQNQNLNSIDRAKEKDQVKTDLQSKDFMPAEVAPIKPEVRFRISNTLENNVKTQANKHPEETSSHYDTDYVSIKTLEALPIPMLAVDTKGEVLFYNQDWVNLQQHNKDILGVKSLMRVTRDLMAKMAFDGNLEIDSILNLPASPEGYSLKMKSILGDHDEYRRVIGYIFWIENMAAQNSSVNETKEAISKTPGKTNISKNQFNEESNKSYMGKTLIDLLEIEEKKIMQWAMEESGHNKSNAAMLLGIPRQTFSYRFHKLFDEKPSNKSSGKTTKKHL